MDFSVTTWVFAVLHFIEFLPTPEHYLRACQLQKRSQVVLVILQLPTLLTMRSAKIYQVRLRNF